MKHVKNMLAGRGVYESFLGRGRERLGTGMRSVAAVCDDLSQAPCLALKGVRRPNA